ncbi:MAG: lipopolysaccharide biosynthesis protein [Flavobacteriales bacterium]
MATKLFKSFGYKAVQIIVLILYSLLLVPILLNFWNLEVYGSWIALYAFFNIIQVIELGHSTFVGNHFNKIVHTKINDAKILLGSALRANIVVGFLQICLVLLFYVLGLFNYLLDKNIDDKEVVIVLLILFLYRMIIGSFRGIIVKILNPFGLIYKGFQFSLFEKIVEFFILITAAILGASLLQLAVFWLIIKFIYSSIILVSLKKLLPDFFPWWKFGNFKFGIQNFIKSIPFGLSNFIDRLSNDGVVLVVSAFVGTSFLPLFSATRTLVNMGLKISDFFISPIVPEIINYFAKNRKKKILDIIRSYWFVTSLVLMSGYIISLFFIKDLFHLWTHNKLSFDLALYSALVIILLVQNYGKVLQVVFMSINKTKVVLTSSVLKVSIFFICAFMFKNLGIYGVLLSLVISEFIVVTFWLPTNSFKLFQLKGIEKFKFYVYLISVICLAILFYFNVRGVSFWILFGLTILIISLNYIQFTFISKDTKASTIQNLKKLLTFVRK